MTWQKDFEPDGSLRDIYVLDTTVDDWRKVIDYIRQFCQPARYTLSEKRREMPDVLQVFALRDKSPLLMFQVGKVELACHFFGEEQIEFDFWPDDIETEKDLQPLLDFIRTVGRMTGKEVILTPESSQESPFMRYQPGGDKLERLEAN